MLKITRSVNDLVAEAEETVISLTPSEVMNRLSEPGLILIDLRDIRELKRDGRIPGSVHVPRGMLEFWVDPTSPYYRKQFDDAESLILYCNKGSRSALAAQSLEITADVSPAMIGAKREPLKFGFPVTHPSVAHGARHL